MLFKDFIFSFKNIHLSYIEKKLIYKLLRVGFSLLYKYIFLELFFYNFVSKKNLDKIAIKNKSLFNKNFDFLFKNFNSLRKLHNYSNFFNENLKHIKNKKLNILEIGMEKGAGLASFYFYFPYSNIIGVDNNPFKNQYKSTRIRNLYVDISSKKILKNLSKHLDLEFDLIIDDCSHKLIDQILCFVENFKNLKKGGIYIAEDLNFPEIHKNYNPTNEILNLKSILKKIELGDEVNSDYIEKNDLYYLKNNIENIKFYKSKNVKNYLIMDLCDYSEIVFVKKK